MKIIAAVNSDTFLVEMNGTEMAIAAGCGGSYDSEWTKLIGRDGPKVGKEIKVAAAYNYHARVSQHQKEAAGAANTLRALADLISGALPDVVLPSPEVPVNP